MNKEENGEEEEEKSKGLVVVVPARRVRSRGRNIYETTLKANQDVRKSEERRRRRRRRSRDNEGYDTEDDRGCVARMVGWCHSDPEGFHSGGDVHREV
ncbi:hypothetical protein E2C01_012930 [Portunus trituberculatus]|uniref:Uncharacterized protein n=1 Tax=Portunus trituberculatus TaxID=210409 RepID=A0A5B7DF61_PORTR|nr:hypothetical protein [Portunus trituberculatus]